jgi:hypothetical protein
MKTLSAVTPRGSNARIGSRLTPRPGPTGAVASYDRPKCSLWIARLAFFFLLFSISMNVFGQVLTPQGMMQRGYGTGDGFWVFKPQSDSSPTGNYGSPRIYESRQEGWKVHVSANPNAPDLVLQRALSKLRELNVHHKIILPQDYDKFVAKAPEEKGKFITVYPRNYAEFQKVAGALEGALSPLLPPPDSPEPNHDVVPNEYQIYEGRPIYARYGRYSGTDSINVPDDFLEMTGNRKTINDDSFFRKGLIPDEVKQAWKAKWQETLKQNPVLAQEWQRILSQKPGLELPEFCPPWEYESLNNLARFVRGDRPWTDQTRVPEAARNATEHPAALPASNYGVLPRQKNDPFGKLPKAPGPEAPAPEAPLPEAPVDEAQLPAPSSEQQNHPDARLLLPGESATTSSGAEVRRGPARPPIAADLPPVDFPDDDQISQRFVANVNRALQSFINSEFRIGDGGFFLPPGEAVRDAVYKIALKNSGGAIPEADFRAALSVWQRYKVENGWRRESLRPERGPDERGRVKGKEKDTRAAKSPR